MAGEQTKKAPVLDHQEAKEQGRTQQEAFSDFDDCAVSSLADPECQTEKLISVSERILWVLRPGV
jgi:hypothetical protein